jgi:hypothetical protein
VRDPSDDVMQWLMVECVTVVMPVDPSTASWCRVTTPAMTSPQQSWSRRARANAEVLVVMAMVACGRHAPAAKKAPQDAQEQVGLRDGVVLPMDDKRTWEHPVVPLAPRNHLPDFGREPLPCESYDPAKSRDSEGIRQMMRKPCPDAAIAEDARSASPR